MKSKRQRIDDDPPLSFEFMTDTERIDWIIKVNAMIWNRDGKGKFSVCVPELWLGDPTGRHAVEASNRNLRKAIDQARKWMEE